MGFPSPQQFQDSMTKDPGVEEAENSASSLRLLESGELEALPQP